jgi:hypothetical protein
MRSKSWFSRKTFVRVAAFAALAGCDATSTCAGCYFPEMTVSSGSPASPGDTPAQTQTTAGYVTVAPQANGAASTTTGNASGPGDDTSDDSRDESAPYVPSYTRIPAFDTPATSGANSSPSGGRGSSQVVSNAPVVMQSVAPPPPVSAGQNIQADPNAPGDVSQEQPPFEPPADVTNVVVVPDVGYGSRAAGTPGRPTVPGTAVVPDVAGVPGVVPVHVDNVTGPVIPQPPAPPPAPRSPTNPVYYPTPRYQPVR